MVEQVDLSVVPMPPEVLKAFEILWQELARPALHLELQEELDGLNKDIEALEDKAKVLDQRRYAVKEMIRSIKNASEKIEELKKMIKEVYSPTIGG